MSKICLHRFSPLLRALQINFQANSFRVWEKNLAYLQACNFFLFFFQILRVSKGTTVAFSKVKDESCVSQLRATRCFSSRRERVDESPSDFWKRFFVFPSRFKRPRERSILARSRRRVTGASIVRGRRNRERVAIRASWSRRNLVVDATVPDKTDLNVLIKFSQSFRCPRAVRRARDLCENSKFLRRCSFRRFVEIARRESGANVERDTANIRQAGRIICRRIQNTRLISRGDRWFSPLVSQHPIFSFIVRISRQRLHFVLANTLSLVQLNLALSRPETF